MKYYIGVLDTRNGEYEYDSHVRFSTKEDPAKYLERIARSWYGIPDSCTIEDCEDEAELTEENCPLEDGGFYHNCGEVHTSAGNILEIDKKTFDKLTILTEM